MTDPTALDQRLFAMSYCATATLSPHPVQVSISTIIAETLPYRSGNHDKRAREVSLSKILNLKQPSRKLAQSNLRDVLLNSTEAQLFLILIHQFRRLTDENENGKDHDHSDHHAQSFREARPKFRNQTRPIGRERPLKIRYGVGNQTKVKVYVRNPAQRQNGEWQG